MEILIFYFVVAHLVLLTQLSNDDDFNLKLSNSYLWPTFLFKKVHNFLVLKLVYVIDIISLLNEPFRELCTKAYFKLKLNKLF